MTKKKGAFHRQKTHFYRLLFTSNLIQVVIFLYKINFTSEIKSTRINNKEMDAYQNSYTAFAGMTMDEYSFIHHASAGLSQNQMATFMAVYNSRRKNPTDILLATLLGFLGLAGVQRFLTGNIILGLLYLITGGFLGIGTLVDLFMYKSITDDYNRHLAYDCYHIAKAAN
jgi:TM2 domain-containing membrane protein YozV